MLIRSYQYIQHSIVFIFIFSFFNDFYLVDNFGENILKIIFILFLSVSWMNILENIKTMNFLEDKLFFMFITSLIVVFLFQNIIHMSDDIIKPIFSLISIVVIILYFSRYPLERALYFVWLSMVASVMICYFNDPYSEWTFRKTGGTGDPNNFSAQLLPFIFTSFYLYTRNKSKVFLLISSGLFIYGLFSAGSKSGFLIFGLIIFLGFFIKLKHLITPKNIVIFFFIFISLISIDFTKIEAISNMLGRTSESKTVDTRFVSWMAGLNMVEAHPFIGVGVGQFSKHTHKYADVKISATAAHNTYIQIVAESGIPVLILFLAFLYILLFYRFKILISNETFWVYLAMLSILLMGLTLGLTYMKFQWLYIAIMMQVLYLISKGKSV